MNQFIIDLITLQSCTTGSLIVFLCLLTQPTYQHSLKFPTSCIVLSTEKLMAIEHL